MLNPSGIDCQRRSREDVSISWGASLVPLDLGRPSPLQPSWLFWDSLYLSPTSMMEKGRRGSFSVLLQAAGAIEGIIAV
jgi:hypothetical protein